MTILVADRLIALKAGTLALFADLALDAPGATRGVEAARLVVAELEGLAATLALIRASTREGGAEGRT